MLQKTLKMEIEQEIGQEIMTISPLSTANNAYIYKLSLSDGEIMVAKVADAGLDTEAFMLNYLREHSNLPVPEVYYNKPHVMIMDFIQADWHMEGSVQKNAGELLAHLHQVKADKFGFEQDTLIGSLHQPNDQMENWAEFFIEKRLLYMAEQAVEESVLNSDQMEKIETLCQKIPNIIGNRVKPTLIHGDVWSGNILSADGEVKAFVDPAIYYADPEVELAFTFLNGFEKSFFKAYHDISPIEEDFFKDRCDLYNLYPLLVHARLFGRSYVRKVEKILDRFV